MNSNRHEQIYFNNLAHEQSSTLAFGDLSDFRVSHGNWANMVHVPNIFFQILNLVWSRPSSANVYRAPKKNKRAAH